MNIQFLPIDFAKHSDLCVRYREDSFVASFGDGRKFHEEDGQGSTRYLEWLKTKAALDPRTCVHMWNDGKIVGQVEMGPVKAEPTTLKVNLFYLDPSVRLISTEGDR